MTNGRGFSSKEVDLIKSLITEVKKSKGIEKGVYKQVRDVVSAKEWLSDYYIGESINSHLFPFWRDQLVDIIENRYNLIIITGALGTGKSLVGELLIVRGIYELSCFEKLPLLFNLPSDITQIVLMALTVSIKQAMRTGFARVKRIIDNSRYFYENFQRVRRQSSAILFENTNEVACYPGSQISSFIGMDVLKMLYDEANFVGKSKQVEMRTEEAQRTFQEFQNRSKNRFIVDGLNYAQGIIISSPDVESSFTDSMIKQAKSDNTAKIINVSLFDVKRQNYENMKKFWVFKGFEGFEPFILDEAPQYYVDKVYNSLGGDVKGEANYKVPPDNIKDFFVSLPEVYRSDAEVDIYGILKNVIGISIKREHLFFSNKTAYDVVVMKGKLFNLKHPFKADVFSVSTGEDKNELIFNFLSDFLNIPEGAVCFGHIDQSKSRDATGVALCYVIFNAEGGVDYYIFPLILRIVPPKGGKEIDIAKIRKFFIWLRDICNINIYSISYDQWGSAESIQQFKEAGIESGILSLDKSDDYYLSFRKDLINGHLIFYDYKPFREELFALNHLEDERKVDHERGLSKDVCDAIVGAYIGARDNLNIARSNVGISDFLNVFAETGKRLRNYDKNFSKEDIVQVSNVENSFSVSKKRKISLLYKDEK